LSYAAVNGQTPKAPPLSVAGTPAGDCSAFRREPVWPQLGAGGTSFNVFDKGTSAFDGKAIRRHVTIYFSADKAWPKMDLLIYLPADAGACEN
jgi:hypothetical protein